MTKVLIQIKFYFEQHPLNELNGNSMCLLNTGSWNGHLENFLSDKIYLIYFSLFHFAETNINDSPSKNTDEILHDMA